MTCSFMKGVGKHMRVIKNDGRCSELKSKYLLEAYDYDLGKHFYAKPGLKSIVGYFILKIKYKINFK